MAASGVPAFAAAGGPFGVGTPDTPAGLGVAGPFEGIVLWSMHWQTVFYSKLTAALTGFASRPDAAAWLIGISFLYGVFHAIGPGHGKAVIASYLMASGDDRRRGVLLALAAGLVQAASAIAIVTVAALVFNATAMTITRLTDALQVLSYALIALLGLGLFVVACRTARAAPTPVAAAPGAFACVEIPAGATEPMAAAGHRPGCACAAAIELAQGREPARWPEAAAAVVSIGIRPCSGALIVLVFALSQGLYPAGIASVFAMAAGTVTTVGLVALVAATARGWLSRAGAAGPLSRRLALAVRFAAATVILVFGVVMTAGALAVDHLL
ncbi:MAG: nickel/cobalt transporter [Pararhizobium sp.]